MKNWFDNIRIYHLLIDRFNGGWQVPPKSENVFCGGNLQGVIEKLDYIRELGFTAIMLSPIFKSANYHGYHTLNFEDVDPHFGTWDDYRQLLDQAHEKGLKIICDFVPNHCWYEAPIFAESLLKNGGKHRDWFFYPEGDDSDAFVSFLGFGDLPKFNLTNPEVASFMIDKAERLARMGVDAFRIDHALGQPHQFLQQFRDVLGKLRPAMDILKGDVEKNGYEEASIGLDNIPFKVTYKWGALNHENKGDFEVFVTRDANGCYWSSIRHMAKNDYEDGEECPFFLQFRSLYEVDYMLTILSDENITLSKKKHDLLVRIKQDTN